jgi:hypothetical protein
MRSDGAGRYPQRDTPHPSLPSRADALSCNAQVFYQSRLVSLGEQRILSRVAGFQESISRSDDLSWRRLNSRQEPVDRQLSPLTLVTATHLRKRGLASALLPDVIKLGRQTRVAKVVVKRDPLRETQPKRTDAGPPLGIVLAKHSIGPPSGISSRSHPPNLSYRRRTIQSLNRYECPALS